MTTLSRSIAHGFVRSTGAGVRPRFNPHGQAFPSICFPCRRRLFSNGVIQENDLVLLRRIDSPGTNPVLSQRLKPNGRVELQRDYIPHERIINQSLRDVVKTRKGKEYRVYQPSLGQYTDFTPRLVTPVYSQDAHAILALLDLHPTTPGSTDATNTDRLEIFEAGTGHGALTLHLARAIHAANTTPPTIPDNEDVSPLAEGGGSVAMNELAAAERSGQETYRAWRASRRAVIHSLDSSSRHSAHAERVVKNFRNGMYFHNIDFHVGSINEYLSERLTENGGVPFLDHAILDLPGCGDYFEIASAALKPNGSLLVFCPSITQINSCVLDSKKNGFPLFLETVVELGTGAGVGGREWDVRQVRPRAYVKAQAEAAKVDQPQQNDMAAADEVVAGVHPHEPAAKLNSDGWELICRPKVGERVSGGGFLGLWRKMCFGQKLPSEKPEVDNPTEM
ncbi:uncharacterized protein BP5553_01080 [Venustampulla echinocandica]|uniref:tRNA (adenine(58)-N(1))-methyltransferase catalytic subunit TRM61 n=1 Tax=Venustampulla echinocandica TaxID=2656787 RepID=A0A370U009_9HELO|nr:uncharacterized protein BP5553_01080 [Venustampulla echinocandica]RDL41101.1 hypothetical protein BP5553_01080 [Venustampulla echinocandica]